MNSLWAPLFTVLCVIQHVHSDSKFLQQQFETVVGELQEVPSHPTVRGAAREYIFAHQYAAKDLHHLAIVHFRKSAELDVYSSAPWAGMAVSLSAIGRNDTALFAWKEVIARDPIHADALLILGLDAVKMGQVELGKKYLSQHWLTSSANPLEALLRIAGLLEVYESDDAITASLEESLDQIITASIFTLVSTATSPAWLGLLQQLVDLNAVDVALELASQSASKLSQRELATILTVIPVLEATSGGDGSTTFDVYTQIARTKPIALTPQWRDSVPLAEALSLAAQSMSIISQDPSGPIQLYKASLLLDPTDALTLNNLAWITLQRDGPTESVQKMCELVLELDSEAPYILDTVGWMYAKLGDTQQAIPLLIRSLEISQNPSVGTYDHLGDAYWLAGQRDNALRSWQTASLILHSEEYKQGILEGFLGLAHSVWGIAVVTPEALYDFEFGEMTRRLEDKLSALQNGEEPPLGFAVPLNGVH